MKLTLRSDSGNRLGFVESFSNYYYKERRVSLMCLVEVGRSFPEPYIKRGGDYIPASQIDQEMGIESYVKAKKPFYSVLGTGTAVLKARIAMSLEDGSYLPESSQYELFFINKVSLVQKGVGEWSADLTRISVINDNLQKWFHKLGSEFAKCGGDRSLFLKSRIVQK